MGNRTIVCGLGHVGYRTALLLRRLGNEVTAIYEQTPADWIQRARSLGIVCHGGDARDDALLEKAGIRTADAIIAATDDDRVNLSVAMDAQRLKPGIITVIRLFDTSLAPHIQTALNLRNVLSTSSLAAPVFASAAIGHNVTGYFTVDSRSYAIFESVIPTDSPWLGRTWSAVSATEGILPLFRIDQTTALALEDSDLVQAGQRVMLLRKATLRTDTGEPNTESAPPNTRRGWSGLPVSKLWRDVPATVKGVMAALALVTIVGTVTFRHFLGVSAIDAFYFVITTISTTGYGDYNLQHSSPWLKLFGCFIMLCGAALMATVFSVVTDLLLKARFRRLIGSPEATKGPHAIVVGHNNVGQRIAREFAHAGLPVVILTPPSHDPLPNPDCEVCPVVVADPRSNAALERAGIATATALVAATENDILNLSVALQARKLNPAVRPVIRIFDAALGAKFQSQLGGNAVVSASAVSAPTFAASILAGGVVQATVWLDHLILVQFAATGPCATLDVPAPSVSLRPGSTSGLIRLPPRADPNTAAPAIRISALRLAPELP